MGGFGTTGQLVNGIKYQVVGTQDNKVIVETQDGRTELVDPSILARHKLEATRADYDLKRKVAADKNVQKITQEYIKQLEQEKKATTDTVEKPTVAQEEFKVKTKPIAPKQKETVTEPVNEQKEDVLFKAETLNRRRCKHLFNVPKSRRYHFSKRKKSIFTLMIFVDAIFRSRVQGTKIKGYLHMQMKLF